MFPPAEAPVTMKPSWGLLFREAAFSAAFQAISKSLLLMSDMWAHPFQSIPAIIDRRGEWVLGRHSVIDIDKNGVE